MMRRELTRRAFCHRAGLLGLGTIFWSTGCGQEDGKQADPQAEGKALPATTDPCTDLSDLSEAQVQLRDSFGYVDHSDDPDLACDVCEYWIEPSTGGICGGCTLMAGPIHPAGTCDSFEEA